MAQGLIKKSFGRQKSMIEIRCVIPITKVGGFLPLLPILTALRAVGRFGGAAIAKAINETNAARKQLKEVRRHNQTLEAIAMAQGLYLKPYKKRIGNILSPSTKKPRRPLTDIGLMKQANKLPYFRNVFMRDSRPKRTHENECGIINLDTSSGPGRQRRSQHIKGR